MTRYSLFLSQTAEHDHNREGSGTRSPALRYTDDIQRRGKDIKSRGGPFGMVWERRRGNTGNRSAESSLFIQRRGKLRWVWERKESGSPLLISFLPGFKLWKHPFVIYGWKLVLTPVALWHANEKIVLYNSHANRTATNPSNVARQVPRKCCLLIKRSQFRQWGIVRCID